MIIGLYLALLLILLLCQKVRDDNLTGEIRQLESELTLAEQNLHDERFNKDQFISEASRYGFMVFKNGAYQWNKPKTKKGKITYDTKRIR